MKKYTIHQTDVRVKYVLDKMEVKHFAVVSEDVVCRSYWKSYVRQINKEYHKVHFNKEASPQLVSAAQMWIDRVVALSPVNSPELYKEPEKED